MESIEYWGLRSDRLDETTYIDTTMMYKKYEYNGLKIDYEILKTKKTKINKNRLIKYLKKHTFNYKCIEMEIFTTKKSLFKMNTPPFYFIK